MIRSVIVCMLMGIGFSAFAQNTASASSNQLLASVTPSNEIDWSNFELMLDEETEEWTFHTNANDQILYIDFEKLNNQLEELTVKNTSNKVVYEDLLYELPMNAIYEVSLKSLPAGTYIIELRTAQAEIIRHELTWQP